MSMTRDHNVATNSRVETETVAQSEVKTEPVMVR
jgi:hypothetical protein